MMVKGGRALWRISGRAPATDEELLTVYKNGMFLNQIRAHYKVGLKRLRRIVRGASP